ncbi:ABC transporter substrate-binding protein [Nocardioides sp. AE5]|uniref:ABC transporter substrate-binding protein n=1 Tax=Nocardioides sp. AE5 TaxID=2962573 RepID=UPI00288187B2|nr:ABC transporter substrate-binding protein [Nocardioides sp. AE5]MDT0203224.1 ABC transporter substrate-binding protein [Nocardioides sp. AE5]
MKRGIARIAGAVALVLMAACGAGNGGNGPADPNAEIDPAQPIVYQNSWAASSLDPHKTRLGADGLFLAMIYDRLVHRDTAGDPIPGLAESWEVDDAGTAVTFHLREGVTFHDGATFDAEAVKLNIARAMEPDSGTAPLLETVESVEVIDPQTVVFHLEIPDGSLILTLSDLPGMMVSPQAFGEDLATKPVGAGRYTLAESDAGARYLLEAYPAYWDPESVGADTFEWQVVADPQTRLNAISSGDANLIQVSTTIVAPARARNDLVVSAQNTLNSHTLNFNRTKSEFDKLEVRQAVLYAMNREEIIAGALDNEAAVASQPFPKGYFAHNAELENLYPHDPQKAKDLLASVGLADGFSFEVLVLNVAQMVREAEIIKAQLAEAGIDMTITPVALADLSAAFNRGEGDAAMNAWAGRGDPSLLLKQYFDAEAPGNPSKSSPDGFDEALTAANSVYETGERGTLLQEVSRILMEDAVYAPIAFFHQGGIASNTVVGYEPYLVGDEFRGVGVAK